MLCRQITKVKPRTGAFAMMQRMSDEQIPMVSIFNNLARSPYAKGEENRKYPIISTAQIISTA
jgi:hypothetical protein